MRTPTASQQQAITSQIRDILAIAGAGSGKTFALTERIIDLHTNRGVPASRIMVLTFTRKAAVEMKSRLRERLEQISPTLAPAFIRDITMGTFHSIGLRILRQDGDAIGYQGKSLIVVDADDTDFLLKEVARDFGCFDGKSWKRGMSGKIVNTYLESFYTTGKMLVVDSEKEEEFRAARLIIQEYHARLFQMNAVDFGRILTEVQKLFTHAASVRERYSGAYDHVLVDELQDANAIQHYGFLDMFDRSDFFGVGDRRQSVYAFRGSRPDLMTERHPEAEIINLRECYRCAASIVDAANTLIAHNNDRLAEPMICATGKQGIVRTITGRSEDLIRYTQQLHDSGYAWSEIAIIARSHRVLKRLGAVCFDLQIPHHRVGASFDICESDEFKTLLAAMRLAVDERDNMSFRRLLDPLGISAAQFAEIRRVAGEKSISFWQATVLWAEGEASGLLWELIQFGMPIDELKPGDDAPLDAMLFIATAIGAVFHDSPMTINKLLQFWTKFVDGMTLVEAVDWYATSGQHGGQEDLPTGNRLTLLTSHAAKGLEWPCVIVANCNEGDYPSSQSKTPEAIEEERRLMYVAWTRSISLLVLHYRRPEDQAVGRSVSEPSRFLAEAGF